MKPTDSIFLVAIVLTAVVSIGAVRASTVDEPQETTPEPTQEVVSQPTIEETTIPETVPTQTETSVTEPPEATEPTTEPETEPEVILYDVPLSEDLQLHIIGQAESHGIDPAVVFALIWKESRYNTWSGGDGGQSLGLMQIQPKWHQWRMNALGCPDLFDPYQNVTVGCHILGEKLQKYGNIEMALVAYNAGDSGAYNHYFSNGVYSSKYSKSVMEKAEELRGETYVL